MIEKYPQTWYNVFMLSDSAAKSEIFAYATKVRRDLHRIPELTGCEYETSAYIKERLGELGLKYKSIHTGLYADIAGQRSGGKMLALRCDMDALPISEKTGLPFRAEKNMHACGHDAHMAIVLGVAKILAENRPPRDVRLIFQYGEEGDGGADKMIKSGVIDNVGEIYAFHLCPELEKGKTASCLGAMFAGTVEFDVKISGLAAHCADREKGRDALASALDYMLACREIDTREENMLLHSGAAEAGHARNIVADCALVKSTLRYFDCARRDFVMGEMARRLAEADAAHGTASVIDVKAVYPPLVNSPAAFEKMNRVTPLQNCGARYTAEDFAFYTEKIDGCMSWLGIKDETHSSPLHSDTFDFDESVLLKGIEIMTELCFEE